MIFDFKKEQKEYYHPTTKPEIIQIPKMNFIAIQGTGNPNKEDGQYKQAVQKLYAIAYTLKMSYKTNYTIPGFFEYVVPPLEGYWWQENIKGVDLSHKEKFCWIAMIRTPDFINKKDIDWAKEKVRLKKKLNVDDVEMRTFEEGLCVQMLHKGSYDDEINTVKIMNEYIHENNYINDFSDTRMHHEIYLSDPRKIPEEKLKTIIRHPIRKS